MEEHFSDINLLKEKLNSIIETCHDVYMPELVEKIGVEWLKENRDILEYMIVNCSGKDIPELVEKIGVEWLKENRDILEYIIENCYGEYIPELVEKIGVEWLKENTDILEYIIENCYVEYILELVEKIGVNWVKENSNILNYIIETCYDVYMPELVEKIGVEWLKENTDVLIAIIGKRYYGKYIPELVEKIGVNWVKENRDILEYIIENCSGKDILELVEKIGVNWVKENRDILNNIIEKCSGKDILELVEKIGVNWVKENRDILNNIIERCPGGYIPELVEKISIEWLEENPVILKYIIEKCSGKDILELVEKIGVNWVKENRDILNNIIERCYDGYIPELVEKIGVEWVKENTDVLIAIIGKRYSGKDILELVEKIGVNWVKENRDILNNIIEGCPGGYIPELVEKIGVEWLKENTDVLIAIIGKRYSGKDILELVEKIGVNWVKENRDILNNIIKRCYDGYIPELVEKIGVEWLKENIEILTTIVFYCYNENIPELVEKIGADWLKENPEVLNKIINRTVFDSCVIIIDKLGLDYIQENKEMTETLIKSSRIFIPEILAKLGVEYLEKNLDVLENAITKYYTLINDSTRAEELLNRANMQRYTEKDLVNKLNIDYIKNYELLKKFIECANIEAEKEDIEYTLENGREDIIKDKMWENELILPNYIKFKQMHNFEPTDEVLIKYPTDKIEVFNKKTWFNIAKHNIFHQSSEVKNSLVEMSQLFGVFEKDDEVQNRIKKMHEIATYLPEDISIDEIYEGYEVEGYAYVKDVVRYQKVLDLDEIDLTDELNNGTRAENIENELKFVKERLRNNITESEYQNLKKISERNVLLRKVLDKMYDKQKVLGYRLEKKPVNEKELTELQEKLEEAGVRNVITANKLHNMFDGSNMEYNPNLYKFIESNLEEIIKNPMICGNLSSISREWSNIQKAYGVKELTIEHCLRYYDEMEYENIGENYKLAKVCKQNGISQEDFEELQEIYKVQKTRKVSSIPEQNVGSKNEVRGVTLRLDDPRALVIGMPLMTNCCQSLHGVGEKCMIHSATSKDGRVFVVLDEDDNILMQSWMWMSKDGKTICYDNPESSIHYDNNRKKYEEKVVEVYKKHGESLIKKQNDRIEKEKQEKLKEANIFNKKKIQERYESLKIEQVTMGVGYADAIDLNKYFNVVNENEEIEPDNYYGYRDSDTQVLIAGKEDVERKEIVKSKEREQIQQVFEDKSVVERKNGYDIVKSDIDKIKEMENDIHKKSMINYENIQNVEDLAYLYNEEETDMKIRYGKSWYTVYADREDAIHIYDLAKEKEADISADLEMMEELGSIIAESIGENGAIKQIEAELREDTSYRLYLKLLKNGLVEQIGSDVLYIYEQDGYEVEDGRNFTEEEQEEILKDKKGKNSQEKTKNTNMHRIVFKPTEEYLKSKIYRSMQEKRKKEVDYGWELG